MNLTTAELALVNGACALARDHVAPHAAQWEREQRLGHEALNIAVGLGLTRIQVPESFGGLALSFACKAQVAEVLAGGDFGFTMSLINTQNIAAKLARDAPVELARQFVPDQDRPLEVSKIRPVA